jgi:hypothetical protein
VSCHRTPKFRGGRGLSERAHLGALPPIVAGSARCADRAALSGAIEYLMVSDNSFRPLDAGGDIAARCPYLWGSVKMRVF